MSEAFLWPVDPQFIFQIWDWLSPDLHNNSSRRHLTRFHSLYSCVTVTVSWIRSFDPVPTFDEVKISTGSSAPLGLHTKEEQTNEIPEQLCSLWNFVCEPAGLSNKLFKKGDFTSIGYLIISCPSTFFIWQEQGRLKGDKGRELLGPHYGCFPSLSLRWSSRSAAEDLNLRSPESLRDCQEPIWGFSMSSKLSATFHNTLFSPMKMFILNLWNSTRVN